MAQPKTGRRTGNAPGPMSDAYRETVESIESITVAFILAFVFRAFVVEAFVIPTGSMAATLYGEHWTHNCSDCGYEFAVGATRDEKGLLRDLPHTVQCPNCSWEDEPRFTRNDVESGDRILVLKWPWDAATIVPQLGPHRWDVTVFKDPKDGQTNFIKRLIGLPDEVLMLMDGDLYTAHADDVPAELLEQVDLLRHAAYTLGRTEGYNAQRALRAEITALEDRVVPELVPLLHIQRKTPDAQEALWSIVYNHDFSYRQSDRKSIDVGSSRPRWAPVNSGPQGGWTVRPGILEFESASAKAGRLAFEGKPITDRYAYNVGLLDPKSYAPVTDYRLRFDLDFESGDGALQVELSKYDNVFAVLFKPDGVVQLSRKAPESKRFAPLQTKVQPFIGRTSAAVEIRNVDYRLSVVINGEEVLATTDAEFSPDIAALAAGRQNSDGRPPATIELLAQNVDLELRHVVIDRDVFYLSPTIGDRFATGTAWDHMKGWGVNGHPLLLRDDEYFVLGDNSPASEDARLWVRIGEHLLARGEDYQSGTVPEDQLIGKAFFVYWPSGYKPSFLHLGIVPNVGRMRWIH